MNGLSGPRNWLGDQFRSQVISLRRSMISDLGSSLHREHGALERTLARADDRQPLAPEYGQIVVTPGVRREVAGEIPKVLGDALERRDSARRRRLVRP